jgi:hypothetical protein
MGRRSKGPAHLRLRCPLTTEIEELKTMDRFKAFIPKPIPGFWDACIKEPDPHGTIAIVIALILGPR